MIHTGPLNFNVPVKPESYTQASLGTSSLASSALPSRSAAGAQRWLSTVICSKKETEFLIEKLVHLIHTRDVSYVNPDWESLDESGPASRDN